MNNLLKLTNSKGYQIRRVWCKQSISRPDFGGGKLKANTRCGFGKFKADLRSIFEIV